MNTPFRVALTTLVCLGLGTLGQAQVDAAAKSKKAEIQKAAEAAWSSQNWAEAASKYKSLAELGDMNAEGWHHLGYSLHAIDKLDEALQAHVKAYEVGKDRLRGIGAYNAACVYALKGDKDNAFAWLDKAVEAGFVDTNQLGSDSDMDKLRDDERFKKVIAKMNAAPVDPLAGMQPYSYSAPRMHSRLAFFGQRGSAGQIVMEYGQPEWKADYDKAIDSEKTKNRRWRFGKDFWTTFDTNVPITLGGVKVPPGDYYCVLENTDAGFKMWLLDPTEVRAKKLDAYVANMTTGGIGIPLEHSKVEGDAKTADKMVVDIALDEGKTNEGDLKIRFGPHVLAAPFTITFAK
jgi:tetratricopeptide (TPR) repeat protein